VPDDDDGDVDAASVARAELAQVHVTVKLLSGAVLAELTVENSLRVDELRSLITTLAGIEDNNMFMELTWGVNRLEEATVLCDLGMSGDVDLIAACIYAISGEFAERVDSGCPTCGSYETAHATFSLSRTVSIVSDHFVKVDDKGMYIGAQPVVFSYTLGAQQNCEESARETGHLSHSQNPAKMLAAMPRETHFAELELIQMGGMEPNEQEYPNALGTNSDDGKIFVGKVFMKDWMPEYRRIAFPGLELNATDVRTLAEERETLRYERLQLLILGDYVALLDAEWTDHIQYDEYDQVYQAWTEYADHYNHDWRGHIDYNHDWRGHVDYNHDWRGQVDSEDFSVSPQKQPKRRPLAAKAARQVLQSKQSSQREAHAPCNERKKEKRRQYKARCQRRDQKSSQCGLIVIEAVLP
jgi:hypothetical protein